jgi:predicted RNase H-like nuclease (RuvC/YqgF family)
MSVEKIANEQLSHYVERLQRENAALRKDVARLEAENERLRKELEEAYKQWPKSG